MVVLSDRDYRALMEAGRLKIVPEPEDHDLQPASIELRMGRETWITNFKLPTFDIGLLRRFGKRYFIKDGEDLILYPGLVYYVKSLAEFEIPVPAKTEGRSSLGRLGVSVKAVNRSHKYIEANHKGPLWFVIEAHAFPVKIYPGTAICHLVLRDPTNMDIMPSAEVAAAYGRSFALYPADGEGLLDLGAVARGNALQLTLAEMELKRGVDRGRPFDIRAGADEGDYFESVDIGEEGVVMEAGRFYLAHARERVMVNNEVVGFLQQLDPESGILAHWEAGLFDPGFVGQPVLEMMQFGKANLLLFPGQEIGKLVFERLSRPSARGYGDFKGKAGKGKYYAQSGTVTSRIYME